MTLQEHPIAKRLGPKQIAFAKTLARNHSVIRLYRSRGEIILSRQAMHSHPGARELFIVRRKGEPKQ